MHVTADTENLLLENYFFNRRGLGRKRCFDTSPSSKSKFSLQQREVGFRQADDTGLADKCPVKELRIGIQRTSYHDLSKDSVGEMSHIGLV